MTITSETFVILDSCSSAPGHSGFDETAYETIELVQVGTSFLRPFATAAAKGDHPDSDWRRKIAQMFSRPSTKRCDFDFSLHQKQLTVRFTSQVGRRLRVKCGRAGMRDFAGCECDKRA